MLVNSSAINEILFVYFMAQNAHCKWLILKCNLYLFELTVLSLFRCIFPKIHVQSMPSTPIYCTKSNLWSYFFVHILVFSFYFWKRDVFCANISIIFVLYFSFLSHFICGSLIRHISCTNFIFRKLHFFFRPRNTHQM